MASLTDHLHLVHLDLLHVVDDETANDVELLRLQSHHEDSLARRLGNLVQGHVPQDQCADDLNVPVGGRVMHDFHSFVLAWPQSCSTPMILANTYEMFAIKTLENFPSCW